MYFFPFIFSVFAEAQKIKKKFQKIRISKIFTSKLYRRNDGPPGGGKRMEGDRNNPIFCEVAKNAETKEDIKISCAGSASEKRHFGT